MVGPPAHVYSGTLSNKSEGPMTVEVHYTQEREGADDLQEVVSHQLGPNENVTLEQKTHDEGSWTSTYQISRVVARSGVSNSMAVLEAPMPGVQAPTKSYKFDINPKDGGRHAVEGSN